MKKLLIGLLVLGAFISVTGCVLAIANTNLFQDNRITGSGNIVTRTIDAPAFDAIDASRAIKVIIAEKADGKILIEADDNLIDYVIAKVSGKELIISIENQIKSLNNCSITVTVPANGEIRSLDASSAASIVSQVPFTADKFDVQSSSAAKIEATVEAHDCQADASSASKIILTVKSTSFKASTSSAAKIEAQVTTTNCDVEASSASKILLSGTAAKCEADLSSAATLNAEGFAVENYTISTSSGSSANINCTKDLRGEASSGSSIRYTGDCTADNEKSSGGSIRKNN